MNPITIETTFAEFCEKLLPGDKYETDRIALERYVKRIPDSAATQKLLQYLCKHADTYRVSPDKLTSAHLRQWGEDIAMHADLDMLGINDEDLIEQMTISREVIRRVMVARIKEMMQQESGKAKKWLLKLSHELQRMTKERSGRVQTFLNELQVDNLFQALQITSQTDSLSTQESCFLVWCGPKKIREILARILKDEYDWIERRSHIVKAFPLSGDPPPGDPIVWKGDESCLVLLVARLKEMKYIRVNKGKGLWKATRATFWNNSKEFLKKNLAKTYMQITNNLERNQLIINQVDEVLATLAKESWE